MSTFKGLVSGVYFRLLLRFLSKKWQEYLLATEFWSFSPEPAFSY
jgi:hypothetical protein